MLTLCLCGCNFFDQEVYVDIPDHENRIVFNSFINTKDSIQRFLITRSVDIESSESVAVALRDADLELKVNGTAIENVWFADSAGHYLAEYKPQPGDVFDVNVVAGNFPAVQSSTTIPQPAVVTSAKFDGKRVDFDGYEYDAIKFTLQDIPDEENYYEIYLIIVEVYEYDGVEYYSEYDLDYIVSPLPIFSDVPRGLALSDAAFKNSSIDLEIRTDYFQYSGDGENRKAYVAIRSTTKSYFEYMTIYDIHEWNQYPDLFSGEPVPMYSNIENGYGIFGAYSESRTEIREE